jgi:hypothetical protein
MNIQFTIINTTPQIGQVMIGGVWRSLAPHQVIYSPVSPQNMSSGIRVISHNQKMSTGEGINRLNRVRMRIPKKGDK